MYTVRRVVLLPASFPGCHTLYSMGQQAGKKPGNKASYYKYTSVSQG